MIEYLSTRIRLLIKESMRFGALFLIFHDAFNRFHKETPLFVIMLVLIVVTLINDFVRERFLKKYRSILYGMSFILSGSINTYFSYKLAGDGTSIYSIVLITDIMFNKKIDKFLLTMNFISYSIPYKISSSSQSNLSIEQIFLKYCGIFIIIFIMRSLFVEKTKVIKLNEELTEANSKLKEYSCKIEELTVSRERTRIAQELHDSIGHSLVALSMNLEYAQNVADIDSGRAKTVINKAHGMTKDCIQKLRDVVSVMKEDSSVSNLHEAINSLFLNFKNNEKYEFDLKMYDGIEEESGNIKSCIYKTVMEGITNGIKHGKAKNFCIEVDYKNDNILFQVRNDGYMVKEIKKSNGILGIEKRIHELNGTVKFSSKEEMGFIIDAIIPAGREKL